MKSLFSCWLCVAALAASPATRPTTTTAPATPSLAELRQRVGQANDAVLAAEEACLHRLAGTPSYAAAVEDRDAKEKRLAETRKGSDPKAKMDASRTFVTAKLAVEKVKAQALDDDAVVVSARAKAASAASALHDRERDDMRAAFSPSHPAKTDSSNPIDLAIQQHRVVKGMTEAEMRASMNFHRNGRVSSWNADPQITDDGEGNQIFAWSIGHFLPMGDSFYVSRHVVATLKDGLVVRSVQTVVDDSVAEPQD